MNCLAGCGQQDVPVYKTLDDGFSVTRIRWCQCGARWKTEETTNRTSLNMAPRPVITDRRRPPTVTGGHPWPPTVTNDRRTAPDTPGQDGVSVENHVSRTESQAVAPFAEGGLGGGLGSDPVRIPDPGPILSQPPISGDRKSDERPRRVKPLREPEYPPEFETLWAACDRQGSKVKALVAWQQVGSPPAATVGASWARWKRVQWVDAIGVPHVSSWLRDWRWKQEPAPRVTALKPQPAAAGAPRLADYCDWHQVALNARKPALRPRPTCPECRHLEAARRDRTSDGPQSLFDIGERR